MASTAALYPNAYSTGYPTPAAKWTTTANALGATAANFATYTTAINAEVGSVLVQGYGAQTAIGTQPPSITNVQVNLAQKVANTGRWSSVSVRLYSATTALGTAQTATLSATGANVQTLTFTGVKWAQLADLRVLVSATKNGTQSSTFNLDYVGVVVNFPGALVAPTADFTGTPVSGVNPLTTQFYDQSTGEAPTSWAWTFGDGTTSTQQNPSKTWAVNGDYTVSMTATNDAGSTTATKTNFISVHGSAVPIYPTEVLYSDPEIYLRLGEASGTVANDSSGKARHGTYTATGVTLGIPTILGDGNTAASFSSSGTGQVTVPHNAAFNLHTGTGAGWSIAFRYRPNPTAQTFPGIIKKGISATSNAYGIYYGVASGFLSLKLFTTEYASPAASVVVDEWAHWVITCSPSGIQWYKDGAAITSIIAASGHVLSNTEPLLLNNLDNYGDASIDEFALFKSTLTQTQITRLFQAQTVIRSGWYALINNVEVPINVKGTAEEPPIVFVGKRNSFIGVSSGSAITTLNSGDTSGDAFDVTSGSVVVNTSADLTAAYDRGMIASLSATTSSYVAWTHADYVAKGYVRCYVRRSALPAATQRIARGYNGATIVWELRWISDGMIILADGVSGLWVSSISGATGLNTIYRVEAYIAGTTGELRVYEGESTTPFVATQWDPMTAPAWNATRFGVFTSANQTMTVEHAAIAVSPTDWIGPA